MTLLQCTNYLLLAMLQSLIRQSWLVNAIIRDCYLSHFITVMMSHSIAVVMSHFIAVVMSHSIAVVMSHFIAVVMSHFIAVVCTYEGVTLVAQLQSSLRHCWMSLEENKHSKYKCKILRMSCCPCHCSIGYS